MRNLKYAHLLFSAVIAALTLTIVPPTFGQSAREIMEKYHLNYYYAADDGMAKVTMKLINRQGKTRERYFSMLRMDQEDGGEQKYFIYFHRPGDVRGTVFMVYKHIDRDDDRWLYIPAINLTKRIAANDKRSSFMGSDFTYEDVSGRSPAEDDHSLIKEEEVNGKAAYLVKSTPKEKGSADFAYRLTWVDKESHLPLKEEYYDSRGKLYKVFTADKTEEVDGILTVTGRIMKNLETGHRTEVTFESVKYNVELQDSLFSQRYFKNPPRRWIK
jgi:outer membrane lipoprotein-sorting protein